METTGSDEKEFLLTEYRNYTRIFEKNEEGGETRANLFIALVTLVVGALVDLGTGQGALKNPELTWVVSGSVLALALLGVITLFKILKRNKYSDECKQSLDEIREIWKENYDSNAVLFRYKPFEKKSHDDETRGDGKRTFGGLAHMVAAINAVLLSVPAGMIFYPFDRGVMMALLLVFVWSGAFSLQLYGIHSKEKKSKDAMKKKQERWKRGGGIVYRISKKRTEYLIVNGKGDPAEWGFPEVDVESEKGESPVEAAVRGVHEASGVVCRPVRLIGSFDIDRSPTDAFGKLYLMRYLHHDRPEGRQNAEWLSVDRAFKRLVDPKNRSLLNEAERLVKSLQ